MTAVPGLTLELGLDSKLAREIIELVRDTAFGRSPVAKRVFVGLGLPTAYKAHFWLSKDIFFAAHVGSNELSVRPEAAQLGSQRLARVLPAARYRNAVPLLGEGDSGCAANAR